MNGDQGERDDSLEVSIQDLIKERKAERRLKVEEKRQADLQRIRNMKSATGIDPLQQFPKEIWMKILDELDPEDRRKVWQLHPVFRDLMEATRVRDILFPMVLKIDAFQSYVKQFLDGEFNEDLRRISKSSRKSFEHYMEDKIIQRTREMEVESSAHFKYIENFRMNVDGEPEALPRRLKTFKDGENPARHFFTRGLSISFSASRREMEIYDEVGDDDDDEDDHDDFDVRRRRRIQTYRNQFTKNLTALLEVIGGQIWHFRVFLFQLESTPYTFAEVYMLFQRWISLMPNLQWLEVCIDDSQETIKPEKNKKSIAVDLSRKYPFPRLEPLERISLHFRGDPGQMEIYEALITANPHVKILDFTEAHHSIIQLLPAPQIKSLQPMRISLINDDSDGFSLLSIEPIFNFDWKLKTITLDLDMRTAKLESVFRFLEKFPTLMKVDLFHLQGLRIGGQDDNFGFLTLPNLEHFKVMISDPFIEYGTGSNAHLLFSLWFLLHCKNLKTLSWRLSEIDDEKLRRHLKSKERCRETLDFRAGLRVLHESIIWDVFPYLDTVSVVVADVKRIKGYRDQCTHTYHRMDSVERAPISHFLRGHSCSRNRELQNCVMLLE